MTSRLCVLLFLGLTGCFQTVRFDGGAAAAEFHSMRLNGAPFETETFELSGERFTFEHATFVTEVDAPFQGFQFLGAFRGADPAWVPDAATAPAMIRELGTLFVAQVPEGRCADLTADATRGPGAWFGECEATRGGVPFHMWLSVVPGLHGPVLQVGAWLSPKGKEWVEQFWATLVVKPPNPSTPTASLGQQPLKVIVERALAGTQASP